MNGPATQLAGTRAGDSSFREEAAVRIMAGILSCEWWTSDMSPDKESLRTFARLAVEAADALCEELTK